MVRYIWSDILSDKSSPSKTFVVFVQQRYFQYLTRRSKQSRYVTLTVARLKIIVQQEWSLESTGYKIQTCHQFYSGWTFSGLLTDEEAKKHPLLKSATHILQ